MNPRAPIRLSQLEVECIKVLWRKKTASVAEVRSEIERPLAYTTVMTVLDRMMDKGAVVRHKHGRSYVYSPALDLHSARVQAVHRLLENLFEQDTKALIQFLAEQSEALVVGESRPQLPKSTAAATRVEMDDSLL